MDSAEPSEYEKNYYYFGLPSQPRLVARSSTTVWVPPRDERGMLNKRLRHVGVHTIIDAWNNDSAFLRTEIIRTLVDEGADFHAIDLLRSGYEESQSPSPETGVTTPTGDPRNAPVVLLVSVAPQSLSWPAGRRLAVRCWTVLRRHQFEDVHCEIKESRLQSLAIAPLLPLTNERTSGLYWRHLRHLSESVGTSIAAADEPFRQGALGLYLRDNHSDDVYALTCRHVCFGPEQGGEILPGFPASLSMSKEVVQPGSTTYEELAESLQTLSRDYHLQLDRMEKSQCIMDEDRRLRLMKHHEHHAALVDSALSKFSIREEVQSRVIGEVAYVRDFALGDHDHLSDWCLIRADPSRFSTPLINLQNRLPIGSSSLDSALQLAQNRFPLVKLGDDFTLTLEGLVPVAEFHNCDYVNSHAIPTMIVGVCGPSSQPHFGTVNQAKSVTRRVYPTGQEITSLEWCIIADILPSVPNAAFSKKGDSGSCVWDLAGRVVGMVTWGTGREEVLMGGVDYNPARAVDVTYMSPMEWVLEDIGKCGLDLSL